jgi:hypothetical protein
MPGKKTKPLFRCRLSGVGIKGEYNVDFKTMEDNDAVMLTSRVINTLAKHFTIPEKDIPTFKLHVAASLLYDLTFDGAAFLEAAKDPETIFGVFVLEPKESPCRDRTRGGPVSRDDPLTCPPGRAAGGSNPPTGASSKKNEP